MTNRPNEPGTLLAVCKSVQIWVHLNVMLALHGIHYNKSNKVVSIARYTLSIRKLLYIKKILVKDQIMPFN
jgi:hypothetical protein